MITAIIILGRTTATHTHTASVISDQSHIPTLKSNPSEKPLLDPQQEPITTPNWLHGPTRWKHRVDSPEDQLENQRDIVYFCKSQLYIGVSAFCPHSLLGFQTRRSLLLLLLLRFANRIFDHSLASSVSESTHQLGKHFSSILLISLCLSSDFSLSNPWSDLGFISRVLHWVPFFGDQNNWVSVLVLTSNLDFSNFVLRLFGCPENTGNSRFDKRLDIRFFGLGRRSIKSNGIDSVSVYQKCLDS